MSAPKNKPRVLIVDDEERIVSVFGKLFNNGWDVVGESDPLHARELLLSPLELFDAILLDIAMPDLNGFELFEELKVKAPNRVRRIVFVTGNAVALEDWLVEHRVIWVEKPFVFGSQLAKLEALVEMMSATGFPRGP